MNLNQLRTAMRSLALDRPIFHSESDFQHALAWQIHELLPDCHVRLEVNPYADGRKVHLDMLLNDNGNLMPIELKYKVLAKTCEVNGERFLGRRDGANDHGRYDFLKDVMRLERFVEEFPKSTGYAILLTNDKLYWQTSSRSGIADEFRIHDGKTVNGVMNWNENAGEGSTSGRTEPIELKNKYKANWQHYSQIPNNDENPEFRYLVFKV